MHGTHGINRNGEFGNAEQWVCHQVRRWILEGVLKADEEINQQDLANRLGVSRSPVRDALRRLEGMGLVTINHNQRAVVTSLTLDNMCEIFEMRAAPEGLAARHAAPALSESDLIELASLAEVMLRLRELEPYLAKHEAFHDLIAERAGMPRLRRELAHLRTMATPYIRIYGTAHASAELIGERHEALVEVLRARDPNQACAALASHARAACDQLAAAVAHSSRRRTKASVLRREDTPARRLRRASMRAAGRNAASRGRYSSERSRANGGCRNSRGHCRPGRGAMGAKGRGRRASQIVDLEGKQAIDLLCYSAADPLDRYNAANTMKLNGNIFIGNGSSLWSLRANKMMTVVEDTCGRHDTIGGCCSAEINELRYRQKNTPSCQENFRKALAPFGLSERDIVANVNLFMNVPVTESGEMAIVDGLSKPGDHVDLRAEMHLIVVISNCPQVNNPACGYNPTPIRVIAYRPH